MSHIQATESPPDTLKLTGVKEIFEVFEEGFLEPYPLSRLPIHSQTLSKLTGVKNISKKYF